MADPHAARPVTVAVVGAGVASDGEVAAAERVGQLLATSGATVVTGGLGGVMGAAMRGARAAGGTTIGVLPGTDPEHADPAADVVIPTGLGEARNVLVVRAADVVIAIGGEYGTLSEIAFALKVGTPVVGLRTWELRRRGETDAGIRVAESAEDAAAAALALARGRRSSP